MNVRTFPTRPANDNDEPIVWVCQLCGNVAFVLRHEYGITTICCGKCGEDVTSWVMPSLMTEGDQCKK